MLEVLSTAAVCDASDNPASAQRTSALHQYPNLAQTLEAEIANSVTHGIGFILSVVAAVALLIVASRGDGLQIAGFAIYAATMVAVYAASTASHVFRAPRLNRFLRMLDQGCIYLFIAGSFTPIAATFLRGGAWWVLLAAMWTIAVAGFISKLVFSHQIECASVIIPLVLGWLPIVGGRALLELVPAGVF